MRNVRQEGRRVDHPNIDPIVACIIGERLATLQELKTIYSMEDMMDMYETIMVGRYNEYLAMQDAKAKAKQ